MPPTAASSPSTRGPTAPPSMVRAIRAWPEWEWEATRWRVPMEISRDELEELVERSTVVLERGKHRLIHEGDWRRWGSRGGREALRRYGPRWF